MITMQRIRGTAQVTLGRGGLGDLRQQGSAKAMLPRSDSPDPEVIFLNTAGGVTSGDRLDYGLTVGRGARAIGATQTAERAYRAPDGPGQVTTRLRVGAGAHLDWLPQEVIVFQGAHLDRITDVDLAPDATFLGVESVVLGRAAHGETLDAATLNDRRDIRRDGRLVHSEHLALTPDLLAQGTPRAFATLTYLAPDAADQLERLRAQLPNSQAVRAAASAWEGRLVARFLSPDAAPLRRALIRAIVTLRGTAMPRVWQSDA